MFIIYSAVQDNSTYIGIVLTIVVQVSRLEYHLETGVVRAHPKRGDRRYNFNFVIDVKPYWWDIF